MPETMTAAEAARVVADGLEQHGIAYAIGGAIALGFYAVPRATVDVDINVFAVPPQELPRALAALAESGFVADEGADALQQRALDEGQFRGHLSGLRVDVFVPAIAYYAELATRRRQVVLLGSSGPSCFRVSPETHHPRQDAPVAPGRSRHGWGSIRAEPSSAGDGADKRFKWPSDRYAHV